MTEAASTSMAFITASGFAAGRPEHGPGIAPQLARDADLFLLKARLINHYFGEATELYRRWGAGELSREAVLERKYRLFESLGRECRALWGQAASFDSCPGALNNAGLAFDYTYTKHYPLFYQLFEAGRRDLRATLGSLRVLLGMRFRGEAQFVEEVSARIRASSAAGGAIHP